MNAIDLAVESRARLSLGRGHDRIHQTVASLLAERGAAGTLVDAGCGTGDLFRATRGRFSRCVGLDAVHYPGLPADVIFHQVNLDGRLPVADAIADATAAVETIEHLENPRAFLRLLVRLTRPGGWIFVTTPNQRSLLSLATLVAKGCFSHFQDVHYPAHLTALLDVDLRRIAGEVGLERTTIEYTKAGRIVFSGRHYPAPLSHAFPRALSDNLMLAGQRPR